MRAVANYWGCETIHAGVIEGKFTESTYDNRFQLQEPLVGLQAAF